MFGKNVSSKSSTSSSRVVRNEIFVNSNAMNNFNNDRCFTTALNNATTKNASSESFLSPGSFPGAMKRLLFSSGRDSSFSWNALKKRGGTLTTTKRRFSGSGANSPSSSEKASKKAAENAAKADQLLKASKNGKLGNGNGGTNNSNGSTGNTAPPGGGNNNNNKKGGDKKSNNNNNNEDEKPKSFAELLQSQQVAGQLGLLLLLGLGVSFSRAGQSDAREISFQEFKTKLLEQGLVDRIEVSNKSTAKVFIKSKSGASLMSIGNGSSSSDVESFDSGGFGRQNQNQHTPVSYTHLTLPTKA